MIRTYIINFNDLTRVGLTLSFSSFKMIISQVEVLNPPTIDELGSGFYKFDYDPWSQTEDILYTVSDGTLPNTMSSRIPRQAWDDYFTFDLNDPTATGLLFTFTVLKRVDTNADLTVDEMFKCTGQKTTVPPTINDLGYGVYSTRFRNLLDVDVYYVATPPGNWPCLLS